MSWQSTILEKTKSDEYPASLGEDPEKRSSEPVTPPPLPPPGFMLLNEVGRGGMGIVYRAHDRAFDREIALKYLNPRYRGNYTQETRFLEEARITGKLQHPGIPAVHQTGKLEDGTPYLVMKLIQGFTLGEILWKSNSTQVTGADTPHEIPPNYLTIFEAICQANGFAHAHGVLHRDLKPQNIMVGAFGEVQVMDWGLAKNLRTASSQSEAVDLCPPAVMAYPPIPDHDTEQPDTGLTKAGTAIGTPAYMAPEQAAGNAPIDTRSDVFGLGAILCCMLTGKPPFDEKNPEHAMMQSAMGLLQPVFDRLDASGADPAVIQLAKRCLAVRPEDRPSNGEAVATEVARLRAEAVERAHKAELERAKTQVHAEELQYRRRLLQIIVGILLLAVVASIWGIFHTRNKEREAELQRDIALEKEAETREVINLLTDIFAAARPETMHEGQGRDVTMRQVISKARNEIAQRFHDKPITEARMRMALAKSFETLGDWRIAMEDIVRVLQLREKHLGLSHPDTLQAQLALANLHDFLEEYEEGLKLRENVYRQSRRHLGATNHLTLMAMNNLASSYERFRRIEDALQLRRDVLALTREHLGVQNEFTLLCMNNLGSVYSFHQRHQEALEILEEAIELNQKYLPPDNHVALETIMSKAQCYMLMKETEKALELYLKVLDTRIKYLGINHPDTLFNILDVAEAEMTLGQYRTAYQRLQTALTHFEQTMGHHHSQTLQSLFMMISCLQALQQNKEALPWMRIYLFRFKGRKPENLARVYSLWCQHHEEQQDILSLEQTLQSWHDRNLETSYPMLLKQARYWALLSQSKKKVSGETGKPELKKAVKLLQAARLKGWLDFSLLKNDPVLVELLHREEFREMIQQTRVPARYWHL